MGILHRSRYTISTVIACLAMTWTFFGLADFDYSKVQAREVKREGAAKEPPAKNASAKGLLIRRDGPVGSPWIVVEEKENLPAGNVLLGLPGTMIDSADGAVHINMRSDLDSTSPYPVVENAIVLNENSKVDLDFVLDRGRVDLTNTKKEGAARVMVRVRKEVFELTLSEPGTQIALEVYGRWPRGAKFTKEPGPKDVPTTHLAFLVLKGQVFLKHHNHQFTLKQPPGAAFIEWDSVTSLDDSPQVLKELPPWAFSGNTDSEKAKKRKASLERLQKAIIAKPVGEVLEALLESDDPTDRHVAVYTMGATDDLPRLGKALRETKHPDVWDSGVVALRHWLGRGPGQDQILYARLLDNKYSPVQAETIMQLLHSFGDDELSKPELYQTLIDFLNNDGRAIRGLAYWHLSRLAPEGQKFGYNPLEEKPERAAAIEKWRKYIPAGKLPPKSTDEKKP
ncbi:MAG TPA: hypothetical protein VGZ25_05930 [Gemmataceae bacterium]|nr:hypothetical protein [Gemmataceae bacterium]